MMAEQTQAEQMLAKLKELDFCEKHNESFPKEAWCVACEKED